jgi:hypothetical protein
MTEYAPIIRIILRYLAMFLMTKGIMSEQAGELFLEPATLTALTGLIIGVGTEVWYKVSKKPGRAT